MTTSQGEPPAVARRRVWRALREARDRTPFSQGEVAHRLGWSLSKMQRIEGGEVGVSVTDLRALLDVYGVTDQHQVARLSEDARTSRRERYVTAPEIREHLTPGLRELLQFEEEAVAVRAYQPMTYPGVLQTPTVAELLLGWWKERNLLSDEQRRVRYDVRMARRNRLVERPDGPDYYLIIDQAVVKRAVGSPKVTAEQIEYVAEMAQQPRIHIRIVPFTKGAYLLALSPFQVLDLSDDRDDAVLYRESFGEDEAVHDTAKIRFYRREFESLWDESLSEAASLRVLIAEAAALRAVPETE